ncbi:MAG: 3-oxoacyl-[acyl-carrier-protein] synthase III C-terminal domain-containing protein [Ketobacteraceae bacterium]|nr:3-oxoacyl-[acyl-carrier-protein] synthase III C-terminal domain-containing protein [Ketobacteraceae bacterium]
MSIARFESIGAFLPEKVLSTQELMASMTNPQPIDVEAITGIKERRILDTHENSLLAAVEAAKDCLSRSSYTAEDIDVVISCSISRSKDSHQRNYFDPALSLFVKKELGLVNAFHFDVSNACSGMMTGVHLLTEMIKAGVAKNGIVVSGEQISSIAMTAALEIEQPWDPQFGSLTVGDSGAAVLIDSKGNEDDCIHYMELTSCVEYSELCIGKPSDKTPAYALYTNNDQMHKKERLSLWPHFHQKLLEKQGTTFAEEGFDYIVQHQVGLKFVEKVNMVGSAHFETDMPPAINSVENFANTATTSHFIALYTHLKENKLAPKTKILFVPAASGMVTGCLSATFTNLEVSS